MSTRVIVLDGPDGVGKSTLCTNLQKQFASLGYQVIVKHSPSNRFYEKVDKVDLPHRPLTDVVPLLIQDMKETLQIISDAIDPDAKTIVILDRWVLSIAVYQHYYATEYKNHTSCLGDILHGVIDICELAKTLGIPTADWSMVLVHCDYVTRTQLMDQRHTGNNDFDKLTEQEFNMMTQFYHRATDLIHGRVRWRNIKYKTAYGDFNLTPLINVLIEEK